MGPQQLQQLYEGLSSRTQTLELSLCRYVPKVNSMTILELVERLYSDGLTSVKIGKLMGISVLQVTMYRDNRTKTAGAKVALNIFRHISIDGAALIIAPHRGKQDIFDTVKMYEEQCAQIIRDTGHGHHNIQTNKGS